LISAADAFDLDALDLDALDLDALRTVGDPIGDAAVTTYFNDAETHDPGELFTKLVRHVKLPAEEQVPAIRTFFEHAAQRPDWVDTAAIGRGQEFFNRLAAHHFSALYFASLPNSYAAAKGVQVLRMTGRLQTDTTRRLNETGQFLMDIAAPGAMDVGGVGIDRILHVRLMHAAVRWMIAHDPSVTRVDHLAPPQREEDGLVWSTSWGLPTNQEDLVGTWLTFTEVVYAAFDASGVDYNDQNVSDHMHLWRLVAHYLGIESAIVPTTRPEATALRARIFGRQQAPSAAGRIMTAALVAQAHGRMPKFAWPLLPTAFRHFLGDAVSDMLDVPAANWTRHLFGAMSTVERVLTRGEERHPLHARVSAFIGQHLMDGILKEMRKGDRPAFQIPTYLATDR
jgi:ER-bound oxygenase mpaB/B'/Rubber oxygenase, catalytic domain